MLTSLPLQFWCLLVGDFPVHQTPHLSPIHLQDSVWGLWLTNTEFFTEEEEIDVLASHLIALFHFICRKIIVNIILITADCFCIQNCLEMNFKTPQTFGLSLNSVHLYYKTHHNKSIHFPSHQGNLTNVWVVIKLVGSELNCSWTRLMNTHVLLFHINVQRQLKKFFEKLVLF